MSPNRIEGTSSRTQQLQQRLANAGDTIVGNEWRRNRQLLRALKTTSAQGPLKLTDTLALRPQKLLTNRLQQEQSFPALSPQEINLIEGALLRYGYLPPKSGPQLIQQNKPIQLATGEKIHYAVVDFSTGKISGQDPWVAALAGQVIKELNGSNEKISGHNKVAVLWRENAETHDLRQKLTNLQHQMIQTFTPLHTEGETETLPPVVEPFISYVLSHPNPTFENEEEQALYNQLTNVPVGEWLIPDSSNLEQRFNTATKTQEFKKRAAAAMAFQLRSTSFDLDEEAKAPLIAGMKVGFGTHLGSYAAKAVLGAENLFTKLAETVALTWGDVVENTLAAEGRYASNQRIAGQEDDAQATKNSNLKAHLAGFLGGVNGLILNWFCADPMLSNDPVQQFWGTGAASVVTSSGIPAEQADLLEQHTHAAKELKKQGKLSYDPRNPAAIGWANLLTISSLKTSNGGAFWGTPLWGAVPVAVNGLAHWVASHTGLPVPHDLGLVVAGSFVGASENINAYGLGVAEEKWGTPRIDAQMKRLNALVTQGKISPEEAAQLFRTIYLPPGHNALNLGTSLVNVPLNMVGRTFQVVSKTSKEFGEPIVAHVVSHAHTQKATAIVKRAFNSLPGGRNGRNGDNN